MIKAIIFDCFGVLTTDTWHEFRESLPKNIQPEASEYNRQYCARLLTKDEFLSKVSDLTGETREFVNQLIDNEANKNVVLLRYIAELKQQYKIGLLSNVASNWVRDHLLDETEQQLFDDMLFSFEVGMTKPDPRIFRLAAERLGVSPKECVFVDDIESYCLAAQGEGMRAIVYNGFIPLKKELESIVSIP